MNPATGKGFATGGNVGGESWCAGYEAGWRARTAKLERAERAEADLRRLDHGLFQMNLHDRDGCFPVDVVSHALERLNAQCRVVAVARDIAHNEALAGSLGNLRAALRALDGEREGSPSQKEKEENP